MKKKAKGSFALCMSLIIIILIGTIYSTMLITPKQQTTQDNVNSDVISSNVEKNDNTDSKDNVRGVWVPYMSLDMSNQDDKSYQAFQKKFDTIIENAKKDNINTMVVQIRAFSDAMYPSKYFPYSHLLTSVQGQDPNYDPLKYMVQACHDNGMEFHAWINPYRIQSKNTPSVLADNNMYNVWRNDNDTSNDDYVVDYDNGKYYNPAYEEVQDLIVNGVTEVVQNYDVDAIHFDDYFYPSGADASFDEKAYNEYLATTDNPLSLQDFRKNNVNTLVQKVYSSIKQVNNNVKFGISPQGNIQNDEALGADVTTWCSSSGYVDYICPQIYYNFENTYLPFDKAANQWKELVTCKDVNLYFGLALYKAGSDTYDNGTWLNSNQIIKQQIEYSDSIGVDDFMLYSYDYLNKDETSQEVENAIDAMNKL